MVHTGEQTPQATFLNMESHKLHIAFTAAAAIKTAQPCKLNAAGQIVPLGAADGAYLLIGYAIKDAAINDEISLAMRPFGRITAQSGAAAQTAGPVKWASYDATTKRNVYVAAIDAATTQGFAIDGGELGDQIEVLLLP